MSMLLRRHLLRDSALFARLSPCAAAVAMHKDAQGRADPRCSNGRSMSTLCAHQLVRGYCCQTTCTCQYQLLAGGRVMFSGNKHTAFKQSCRQTFQPRACTTGDLHVAKVLVLNAE